MIRKLNDDGTITNKPVEVLRDEEVIGLQDTDFMSFGKYRGTTMQDVPASYLHYVCHNFNGPHIPPIKDYCKRQLNALKKECPDLIWKL